MKVKGTQLRELTKFLKEMSKQNKQLILIINQYFIINKIKE